MRLINKLKVSFCILMILPIILCCFIFVGLTKYQSKSISESYQLEEDTSIFGNIYTPIDYLSKMTNGIYEEMSDAVENQLALFMDEEVLDDWARRLKDRLSSLVVRKNGVIVYSTCKIEDEDLYAMLPDYGDWKNNSEGGNYYGGEYQALIKQLDFTTAGSNYYSVSIVTSVKQMLPQLKLFIIQGSISVVVVLFVTSALLCMWIYSSIIRPLSRLKLATQNIKEGNLDFELPIDGHDEIAELCRDFEEMRFILKKSAQDNIKSDQEEKELIRNISHDLKTPLTAIKGYVEGLIDGVAVTPEKQEKYLKTIFNKVNDMDRLINELTIYSRIDTNRIPYTFKKISIAEYFEDCYNEISLELESKGIGIKYNNHVKEDAIIIADVEQLKRVINNIVSNSIKYCSPNRKGCISIDIYDEVNYIYITIADNGKGIADKDLSHIFDRFYRTDSSRNSRQGGSGIGLAIVKKIIDEHGGLIWATSKLDEGTVMHIKLKKYNSERENEELDIENILNDSYVGKRKGGKNE